MTFTLCTTGYFYSQSDAERLRTLYGFTVTEREGRLIISDSVLIKIDSLEDLLKLVKVEGSIVISHDSDGNYILEIYDDYRE